MEPQANVEWQLIAGPLTLDICISKTAHMFHVVDQISQWSEFCHRQYVAYFEKSAGGLDKEDRDLLAEHTGIRKSHGWGGGLEQTFYTMAELDAALAAGVKNGFLTDREAQVERRVLTRFQARTERLMSQEAPALRRFTDRLSVEKSKLAEFAATMACFVGAEKLAIPMYFIANPDDANYGGGYNGGYLTLEIPRQRDVYPMLLHELFHAFVMTKWGLIETTARSTPGLDPETLNEGLAYAYNPGLVHSGDSDPLLASVAGYMTRGPALKDSYPRFNTYGLALRPLLKAALEGNAQTLEGFLPRAADAWLVLAEMEKARLTTAGR